MIQKTKTVTMAVLIAVLIVGDIRDIISVGRLIQKSDGPAEIEMIMSTLDRYSDSKDE